ncbi:MAG: MBOAT family protein [Magnetococcales bacterium]|nr:MBOAT family protein [Magnetococcales bacterium]
MLFHENVFLLILLPVGLAGFGLFRAMGRARWVVPFLIGISLWAYSPQGTVAMAALLVSVIGNKLVGQRILAAGEHGAGRGWLALGIGANLALLGWFKYTNFLLFNLAQLGGPQVAPLAIILPAGISFFTFQQIAYLVDLRTQKEHYDWSTYGLFIIFFPQFIAGPIVHHRDIVPQIVRIRRGELPEPWSEALAAGFTLFTIGLAKKLLIADPLAPLVNMVFAGAGHDPGPSLLVAWTGALAYTLQIYFDFSGYSDMAIGLGRMFGLHLPQNFNSPYQAVSISDFWRRWHITLSRFLRDYLYIPLGGNRRGIVRTRINLMLTMLLGGFWHGANWTFVVWGGLHGLALIVARLFPWRLGPGPGRILTFLFVILAWVPFRAPDIATTLAFWKAMAGFNGLVLPEMVGRHLGLISSPLLVFNNLPFRYLWQTLSGWSGVAAFGAGLLAALSIERQNPPAHTTVHRQLADWMQIPAAVAVFVLFLVVFHAKDANVPFLYFQF